MLADNSTVLGKAHRIAYIAFQHSSINTRTRFTVPLFSFSILEKSSRLFLLFLFNLIDDVYILSKLIRQAQTLMCIQAVLRQLENSRTIRVVLCAAASQTRTPLAY